MPRRRPTRFRPDSLARLRTRVAALERDKACAQARLDSVLSLTADWLWEQDTELRFTYISPTYERLTGVKVSSLLGQRREFGDRYDARTEVWVTYEKCTAARESFHDLDFAITAAEGQRRYIRVSGEPTFDAEGHFAGYRGVGRDITGQALNEQRIEQLANLDSLTGLPNRSTFLLELEHALARAERSGQPCALCLIDLDRFKVVNDTLGHTAGDELLRTVALRLRKALRSSDLLARLGGDEFVVLLEGGDEGVGFARVTDKLLAALGEPVVMQQRSFHVSGSIGLSVYPQDARDAAGLLQCADAAMYHAKGSGRNNAQFYTADLADRTSRQFALENELRRALVNDEFVLHYQPRIALAAGRMVSCEALVRWQHPERGLVPPAEFIPVAEESGLIVAIGRWVIQAACRQIDTWRRAGLPPSPVAVNLSARQFASDTLIDDFVDALRLYEVLPSQLEIEITESALMADPDRAQRVLQDCARLGLRIAIDDFGTGYSSLSYLKRFPAHLVKIDRSFIRGLPQDGDDVIITQAVIAMAHSLGLAVVAEGVETVEQLTLLRQLGCDEVQGYYFDRPLPAAQLAERIVAAQVPAAA
ncbi:MAG: putative bifunctional diguanylate cyclase/phosphodiesterase [Rubrivivax sp.]|jgi:diguanylate cyclase (GGDEF)-like protein/PAS domain S-box-containing protein